MSMLMFLQSSQNDGSMDYEELTAWIELQL